MPVNSLNGQDGNLTFTKNLPDLPTVDAIASSVPTMTNTLGATTTIGSAQALFPPDTGPFTYNATMGFGSTFPDTTLYQPINRSPYTWGNSPPWWSVVFGTDATTWEFVYKWVSASSLYRLSIDNRKVTDLMTATGGASVGSRYTLNANHGSTAPRKIRIDGYTLPFGGVFIGANDSIWRMPFTGKRIMVTGDSLSAGSAQNTGAGAGTWFHRFCRLFGYEDNWNTAIGGTGYIADNTGASVSMINRSTDVTSYAPDRLIIWAGYNDNGFAQSAIDAAVRAYFRQIDTYVNAYTLVVGCWNPVASPANSVIATDETIRVAAADAKYPFVSPVTGKVYDANGVLLYTGGQWITSANLSRFIGADNIHPNDAGHTYIARRLYEAYNLLGNV